MLIGILLGCGDSQGVAVDAGTDAKARELVGLVGNGDLVQLADQDASADAAVLLEAAAELELVDAGELLDGGVDAAQLDAGVDAGPCDGAPANGCGGCGTLANPPGTSCAGDFVGSGGICNWEFQCVYECTTPATTIRVCPNGLESCDGRP